MAVDSTIPDAASRPRLRDSLRFERAEVPRLVGLLGTVVLLHVVGWGLFAYYNSQPQYHGIAGSDGTLIFAGAGALAYSFGLRHAFDADHIAAIDDTTRLMLAKGRKPLGVGFFFSLGHSSVVFALSFAIAFAAKAAQSHIADFQSTGGVIGAAVSGSFLWLVGLLNLVILVGIMRMWQGVKRGRYEAQQLEDLLRDRGLMNRIFRGRYNAYLNHSWQLYPVGLLFGLGFDTASEVGLLALSATAATQASLPPLAIISLPVIFAAGMSLMDTLDGIFMTKAYGWAFTSPLRKIYYNITTTSLSIFVALVIGSIELVGVLADKTSLGDVQPFRAVAAVDLGRIGYYIVGVFVLTWLASVALWRFRRLEDRYGSRLRPAADAEGAVSD